MRTKDYLAWKKQHRRRKRAKQKVKLYEQGKLKYEELPRLAKKFLEEKRRTQARSAA